jgi:Tfp pilus assembly protein PilF
MQIVHPIDNFFFEIFPDFRNQNNEILINKLQDYYACGMYKPEVKIENEIAIVSINIEKLESEEAEYKKVIAFCEKSNFQSAKPILKSLIEKNPTQSEYHRIMGQILSDEGDQDNAINYLIDALRWDAKNNYALIMTGNIFAKYKNDTDTALKYYNQSLEINPNDFISLNNIGANLMQLGKLNEAEKYFYEALKINSDYPNTHYALGLIAEIREDFNSAFYSFTNTLKKCGKSNGLYNIALKQLIELSQKSIQSEVGKKTYRAYRVRLEHEGGKQIDIEEDSSIPTSAKIEFAENYNREHHLVKFNPIYLAYEHLVMHELVHLEFVLDARKEDLNLLFVSNSEHKSKFIKSIENDLNKLKKLGFNEKQLAEYSNGLFEGVNRQAFNAPIDLFIEYNLYQKYPELRVYQFLSLYQMVNEGLQAVTNPQIVELSPKNILSKSKIYNLVGAMQFKEFYGVDLLSEYNANKLEMDQAIKFYKEYKDYEQDKEAGEEYELVENWADDLKLHDYFEMLSESQYRKRTNIDELLTSIEKDPFGHEEKDPYRERQMKKFQEAHSGENVNMAVVMFMVDALQYFKGKSQEQVKKIAFEIAILGDQGFFPEQDGYQVASMPDKTFSGYHILAYFYVSWAIAMPQVLHELQLPFDKEYELAKTIEK